MQQAPLPHAAEHLLRACGSNTATPWLCVYTKPCGERTALEHLRNQSFPAFLPLHVEPNDRQQRIVPIFPRYLFAQPFEGSWSAIRSTRGVSGVLRTPTGEAQEVPRRAIERLLALCAEDGVIYPRPAAEIKPGDKLTPLSGPFAELAGICSRAKGSRIWLWLQIMGAPREIEFSRDALGTV